MSKAWIALLSAVLVALVGAVSAVVVADINKSAPAATTTPPPPTGTTPASTTPPKCPRPVRLTAPENGAEINGIDGVKVTGRTCDVRPGESVWLFDYDAYDKNSYLVYDQNSGPRPAATLNDVEFVVLDQPIGDPGDKHKTYTIRAVVANGECAKTITKAAADPEGNYVFPQLPAGCIVADERQILESQG
jgi:hypothetical protein